jgi:hypothetical protein
MKKSNNKDLSNIIHIGAIIKNEVNAKEISIKSIMIHFRCASDKIYRMYQSPHLRTDVILEWSDLLGINLFDKISCIINNKKEMKNVKSKSEDFIFKIFFSLLCVMTNFVYAQSKTNLDKDTFNSNNNMSNEEKKEDYTILPSNIDVVVSFDSIHHVKNRKSNKVEYIETIKRYIKKSNTK